MYINHNLPASGVANTLIGHYGSLQKSTQRLSTGLRINGAADDAAGLAIRELMRADIAALNQGLRNVNDAISMIQTFDGALGVIDEKLIRMKELAEQAATGTYDSVQRLMIDSEFQAMGSEINRIARATDFNGIKMLNGEYKPTKTIQVQVGTRTDHVATATSATASNFKTTNTGATITTVPQNLNASAFNNWLPTTPDGPKNVQQSVDITATVETSKTDVTETKGAPNFDYNITYSMVDVVPPAVVPLSNYRVVYDNGDWGVTDANGNVIGTSKTVNTGTGFANIVIPDDANPGGLHIITVNMLSYNGNQVGNLDNLHTDAGGNTTKLILTPGSNTYTRSYDIIPPNITLTSTNGTAAYNHANQQITATLNNGASVNFAYTPTQTGEVISFDVAVSGNAETKLTPIYENREVALDDGDIPDTVVRIHFGTANDRKEDYYDLRKHDATLKGLGLENVDIQTQENAQNALVQINDAIVAKDKIRAEYGAMQNRLENTATNLTVQAENLQASESRISDTDVAIEMMNFVRQQILTQSAVAMLSQANSMPQMVMSLIG